MVTTALAAALVALQAQPQPPAAAPGTITAAQLESTPPEELVRRLFGDMSHIIFPIYSQRQTIRPHFGIRALQFYTRPYGAGLAGICQTDLLVVTFEPALDSLRREDPPVRPSRTSTTTAISSVTWPGRGRGRSIMKAAVPGSIRGRCR